jgi:hypothetical protein
MTHLKTVGRFSIILSSLVLVGTYVAYQSGCIHFPSSSRSSVASQKPASAPNPASPTSATSPIIASGSETISPEKTRLLMSGSKSGPISTDVQGGKGPVDGGSDVQRKTSKIPGPLMSSSKSGIILEPRDPATQCSIGSGPSSAPVSRLFFLQRSQSNLIAETTARNTAGTDK